MWPLWAGVLYIQVKIIYTIQPWGTICFLLWTVICYIEGTFKAGLTVALSCTPSLQYHDFQRHLWWFIFSCSIVLSERWLLALWTCWPSLFKPSCHSVLTTYIHTCKITAFDNIDFDDIIDMLKELYIQRKITLTKQIFAASFFEGL